MVGVVDQRLPVGLLEPAGEQVGVERGGRDQGQDLAVAGIHGHHRAHLLGAVEPAGRLLLEVEVDRQGQALARCRGDALVLLKELAAAVDDDHPLAVLAAQVGVVGLLDPLLADHVPRLEDALRLLDLVQGGLAQVAEDVGGLLAVAVEPLVLDLDRELRVLEPLDAEARHLGEGEILGQQHRLERRDTAVLLQDLLEVGDRPGEHAGGEPEAVAEARGPAAIDHQAVAGDVLHQQPPFAVEDQAARGLDRQLAQPVVLGELAVVVPLHELGEPEAGGDRHDQAGDDSGQHAHAAYQVVSMLTNHLHGATSTFPKSVQTELAHAPAATRLGGAAPAPPRDVDRHPEEPARRRADGRPGRVGRLRGGEQHEREPEDDRLLERRGEADQRQDAGRPLDHQPLRQARRGVADYGISESKQAEGPAGQRVLEEPHQHADEQPRQRAPS
jgi:hypothetical protein